MQLQRFFSAASLTVMLLISLSSCQQQRTQLLSLDEWTYIQVDSNRGKWGDWDDPEGLRYFGLDMKDITGDGYKDIISGRYFYRNPGGDMTTNWQRIDVGLNVDGMLFVDIDNDQFGDVIASGLPEVYWLETENTSASSWHATLIGDLPPTGHVNGQGFTLGQIVPGGKPEILLSAGDGIHYLEIPANPGAGSWPDTRIAPDASEEGIGTGDIDGDGDIDIAGSFEIESGEEIVPGTNNIRWKNVEVSWWINPGDGTAEWERIVMGICTHGDRYEIADLNGDDRPDIVVTEERYPGDVPNARALWFEQPEDAAAGNWPRHIIVEQYSMNNLDVGDMDNDGDMDVITNEHKGPTEKTQVFENDGEGNFTQHLVGEGKEAHLGAQVADMDSDGDLDIVSHAWDDYQYLHLWRNDAIQQ
ncbi:MAG TPA: FG-GAP-like repeat-containing protein [bacterium]|nr:FG-GAP-like repeat-containing protein [bacterium]